LIVIKWSIIVNTKPTKLIKYTFCDDGINGYTSFD
jgi:hypothetical protein